RAAIDLAACRRGDRMIKRREFIAGLGGAAAWPIAARAQQPAMPLVGFLSPQFARDDYNDFLVPGLKEKYRGLDRGGRATICGESIRSTASARGRSRPQLCSGDHNRPLAMLAAKAATTTIPMVFTTGGDPVALGLVASNGDKARLLGKQAA